MDAGSAACSSIAPVEQLASAGAAAAYGRKIVGIRGRWRSLSLILKGFIRTLPAVELLFDHVVTLSSKV